MMWLFRLTSLVLVGLGQPALWWPLGPLAACLGFALFWNTLLEVSSAKRRFWLGAAWFGAVQGIQLWWLTSHPYLYSYPLLLLVAFCSGIQFGFLCLFITRQRLEKLSFGLVVAALWTLLEWGRLFFLSGHSWNPVGLELASTSYGLQTASLFGVYGMTFLVILTNAWVLRAWLLFPNAVKKVRLVSVCAGLIILPYVYGAVHLAYHSPHADQANPQLSVLLVQPAFPIEEEIQFTHRHEFVAFVIDEWKQILNILSRFQEQKVDLVALPEFTFPFGTYSFVYPHEVVKHSFIRQFGPESLASLPPLETPLARALETSQGKLWMVNNAYWLQGLSNLFNAHFVIGLEDAEEISAGNMEYYSSAIYTKPKQENFVAERYEKRVLVPMGEYIPFEFCKQIAAKYGINGSFTCGKSAKIMHCQDVPFGISICYEETFGDLTRENRVLGATWLLNLTSDIWFPNSTLTRQHLEHARLRTVENGIPLARSCNTGITCVIDSLGRTTAELGADAIDPESISDGLYATIPSYTYWTLYSRAGDTPIIGFSFLILAVASCLGLRRK